jgi:hypothetical protein
MRQTPQNTSNETPLDWIVIPYIRGKSFHHSDIFLKVLVEQQQQDALEIFLKQVDTNDQDQILANLISDKQEQTKLKQEYDDWCKELHVSHNLIYFLEFLSSKNYHRIRNLLKQIREHEYKKSYAFHILSAALVGVAGLGCYFYLHPEQWDIFLQALFHKLIEYSQELLQLAMSAQILSGLIVLFQLARFFYENYNILSNKTTKTQVKFARLSKTNAYYLLSISAQILIFFNDGTANTISSILFILAAVITLASTYLELHHYKNPKALESEKIDTEEDFFKVANYEEKKAYYERKRMQFHAEFIVLVPITIISIASIFLSPHYAFITPIFACCQFIMTTLKTMYIEKQNKNSAITLQNKIKEHETKIPQNAQSNQPEDKKLLALHSYFSNILQDSSLNADQKIEQLEAQMRRKDLDPEDARLALQQGNRILI